MEEIINDNVIAIDDIDETCSLNNNEQYIKENIFNISKDSLGSVKFDKSEFQDGIAKMSKLCGMISALVSVGITPNSALQYISETEGAKIITESNIEMAKIQSQTARDTAKFSYENSQRNMI